MAISVPTFVATLGVIEATEDGDNTCDCTNEASALAYSCKRGFPCVDRVAMNGSDMDVVLFLQSARQHTFPPGLRPESPPIFPVSSYTLLLKQQDWR